MAWQAQRLLLHNAICRTFYGIDESSLILCYFRFSLDQLNLIGDVTSCTLSLYIIAEVRLEPIKHLGWRGLRKNWKQHARGIFTIMIHFKYKVNVTGAVSTL